MNYIVSLLWVGLELMYGIVFAAAFLPVRKRVKGAKLFVCIPWFIMFAYTNSSIDERVKPLLTIIVFTLCSLYLFEGKLVVHAVLAVISYLFIAVIDTAIAYGACLVLDISLEELVWLKLSYLTVATVGKLLELFFAWLLLRIRTNRAVDGIQSKWLLLMLLFPLVSVIMLVMIFLTSQNNEDLSIGAVTYSGILAVANIAILYIIHNIEESTQKERDMLFLKRQIEYQMESYSVLVKNYSLQRKATHEFEKHLRTIRDLLDQKEFSTAYTYISQLQNNRTLRLFNVNTSHPVVDVILNQKYQEAREHGINMQIKVNDLSGISIQPDSLVVLLANLLDNAIEGCQKVSYRKEIICRILLVDTLQISIRNTSLPVEIIDGVITTSKPGKADHGYGIPAICYILDQLDAEYTFDYSDGWFQFAAEVPSY